MDDALRQQLLKVFPAAAVDFGDLYSAPIARLGLQEMVAFKTYLNQKKAVEAMDLVRSKMTGEELANEKAGPLLQATYEMAKDNAEGFSIGKAVVLKGLEVAAAIALGFCGI